MVETYLDKPLLVREKFAIDPCSEISLTWPKVTLSNFFCSSCFCFLSSKYSCSGFMRLFLMRYFSTKTAASLTKPLNNSQVGSE